MGLYIALGAAGLPLFSGFRGGLGVLLGPTGGYIIGFLLTAGTIGLFQRLAGRRTWGLALGMVLGQALCYACGSLWFQAVYAAQSGAIGFMAVLGMCAFPYILPDLAKMAVTILLVRRLSPYIKG